MDDIIKDVGSIKLDNKQKKVGEIKEISGIGNTTKWYPLIEPYETGFLKVSQVHSLHYDVAGNPEGNPVVVLHGGPGGGCSPYLRQFFDPKVYKIICFDQRGSGKSLPLASLDDNTTWHLVEDIESLRKHLKIDRWVVFGGSWGSTLALAYAETHPQVVKALILRGIFTLRRSELIWFYQDGASWLFPDTWEKYLAPIPVVERYDLMSAYHRRLTGLNKTEQLACAKAWSVWEMSTSMLYVSKELIKRAAEDDEFALSFARIECHYFVNGGFFHKENQLIEDAHKLSHIPATIVQGRYDVVCPAKSAWDLHNAYPSADYIWVTDSGHSAKEIGIINGLVEACEKYKHL